MRTKLFMVLIAICFSSIHSAAQIDVEKYLLTAGDTIKFKSPSLLQCYWETPDTLWIKKVRNPKEYKHYRLLKIYKAQSDRDFLVPDEYYNSASKATYKILSFDTNKEEAKKTTGGRVNVDYPSGSDYYYGTLHLLRIDTQEKIKLYLTSDDKLKIEVLNKSSQYENIYKGLSFYKYKGPYKSFPRKATELDNPKQYEKIILNNCKYIYEKSEYSTSTSLIITFNNRFECSNEDFGYNNIISSNRYEQMCEKFIKELLSKGAYKIVYNNLKKNGVLIKSNVVSDSGSNSTSYGDNLIDITIQPQEDYIAFTIKNKTAKSLKLNWDNVIFVDEKQESQMVTHNGVRYMDAKKPKPASMIAPYAELTDMIVPTSRLYYSNISYEWSILAILNYVHNYGKYPNGTSVALMLPIESNGRTTDYYFTFDVIWEYKYPEIRNLYKGGTTIEELKQYLFK